MLRELFASATLFFASLFGIQPAQPAAVAIAPTVPISNQLDPTSPISTAGASSTSANVATTADPAERVVPSNLVTQADLAAAIAALRASLTVNGPGVSSGFHALQVGRIYDSVGESIHNTNTAIAERIGNLTADDIPDLSATYLPIAGGNLTSTLYGTSLMLSDAIGVGTSLPATQFDIVGRLPSTPVAEISVSGPRSLYAQDNRLFVASNGHFSVYNISHPASPVLLGTTVTTQNSGHDLYVAGTYAVAIDGSTNTSIIEVSDPSNPKQVYTNIGLGSYYVGRSIIQGRYLYIVGSGERRLSIWDFNNPRSPRLVGSTAALPSSGYSEVFIDVRGNYAYLTTSNDLTVVDVSNPSSPQLLGAVNIGGSIRSITVDGRYAYLANAAGRLDIVDIGDTSAPSVAASIAIGGQPSSIAKQGRYAYVAIDDSPDSIKVVDVSTPTSPNLIGTIPTGDISWGSRSLVVHGRFAYLAINGGNTVQVFDLGGAYIQGLDVGALQATEISISRDLQVGRNITLGGGVVMSGGFSASAASAIFASSSGSALAVTQNISTGSIFRLYGGSSNVLTVQASGRTGIGTTTPWRILSITGTVGFDGLTGATGTGSLCLSANKEVVYNAGSDACLPSLRDTKHGIVPLDIDALAAVVALQPVSFAYNQGDGRTRYGFIAEDAAAILPPLATYAASTTISGIDDRAVLSVVVKAIQELMSRIAQLFDNDQRHDMLFEDLKRRVLELESLVGSSAAPDQPEVADEFAPREAETADETELPESQPEVLANPASSDSPPGEASL